MKVSSKALAAVFLALVLAFSACGGSGDDGTTDGNGTSNPPAAPSSLGAVAISSSQINLAWTDNSDNEEGFKIERKAGAGGTYSQIGTVTADTISYQSAGLNADATYYYRVRAYNSDGDSSYSNEANATTPSAGGLTLVGSYDTLDPYNLFVRGNYAYVADDTEGLKIIDVSTPSSPTLAATYNTPDRARGVYVIGDHAYVADAQSGLQIINVSNPASPTLTGSYTTTNDWAEYVFVTGSYAFIGDDGGGGVTGLEIVDVSNPASPVQASSYVPPVSPYNIKGVHVSGDYAFVVDGDTSGLLVVDVSDPSSPTLAGSLDTPGPGSSWSSTLLGIFVIGDYAYMADGEYGLQIIDVSNPASPSLVGTFDTPGFAYNVYVSGNYAYVADGTSGLQVIDVSTPASPTLVDNYVTTHGAKGVFVSGNDSTFTSQRMIRDC